MKNASVVNAETSTFAVLNRVILHLSEDFSWQGEDINNAIHSGAIFKGYEKATDGTAKYLGYVLFSDITLDSDEPDIEHLTMDSLDRVEQKMRDDLVAEFAVDSFFPPKLDTLENGVDALISSCLLESEGPPQLMKSFRMKYSDEKWIAVCSFSTDRSDDFGNAVESSICTAIFK
jgi:hypothetical protein